MGRNGWCQHQGTVKGRVLEEGTDLLGLSRYLWLGVPPPPPPTSPTENWELLLAGLQTSCRACKHEVFCVQCPALPAASFLPPSSFSVLFSAVQGQEQLGQDCFQQGVCYTCLMRKTNMSHQLEPLFPHVIKMKSTSIQYLQGAHSHVRESVSGGGLVYCFQVWPVPKLLQSFVLQCLLQ